jgi:transposase
MKTETQIQLKAYSQTEMANHYGVSKFTLRKWIQPFLEELKKIGWVPHQQIYTIAQVQLIWDKLGRP